MNNEILLQEFFIVYTKLIEILKGVIVIVLIVTRSVVLNERRRETKER